MASTSCSGLAWGVIFDKRRDRSFVCLLYFMKRVGVYVGVCMCIRTGTHTHAVHMGYSDVSPGVGRRHL